MRGAVSIVAVFAFWLCTLTNGAIASESLCEHNNNCPGATLILPIELVVGQQVTFELLTSVLPPATGIFTVLWTIGPGQFGTITDFDTTSSTQDGFNYFLTGDFTVAGLMPIEAFVTDNFFGVTCAPVQCNEQASIDVGAAVPESRTWAMLLIGFAGLGFMAYRRRFCRTAIVQKLFFAVLVVPAFCSAQARADVVVELHQGTNEIVGPYQPDADFRVPISAQLNLSQADVASVFGLQVMPGDTWGFLVTISVSDALPIVFCGNTLGPEACATFINSQSTVATIGPLASTAITIDFSFSGFYVPVGGGLRSGFPAADNPEVFADLPDGFSVAPVPEPSTWAMLLIGFAGIGFASYRKRRQYTLVPSEVI